MAIEILLPKLGLRVPGTISLIARDHDHVWEDAISHYQFAGGTFAHRLSRLMLQMVGQGYLPPEPSLIFPRYLDAGTVAPTRM